MKKNLTINHLPPCELLTPDLSVNALMEQRSKMNIALERIASRQRDGLKGHLRVKTRGNTFHYYRIENVGDTQGVYIQRKNLSIAKALAQRDYDLRLTEMLNRKIALIDEFLNRYDEERLFDSLHPGRKAIVEPALYSDDDFVKRWLSVEYKGLPFEENSTEHYSSMGVRVRSKSEVLIADALTSLNIPFKYECPKKIKGIGVVYPDFTCLNVKRHQEYIWEHFGLMDQEDYARRAVDKVNQYSASGFCLGENFIATFETTQRPLNTKYIQFCAKKLLL